MAPNSVLAATALLTSLAFSSAYDSNYGHSLYARSYRDDSLGAPIYARSVRKILARRAAFEEDDYEYIHSKREPCKPGCLCSRHVATREAEAEADAEADPVGDALFEHDDILFNYKRDEASFFDDLEFFDLVSRGIDTREADADADADAEADPIADALFEHDDILFNYRRDIDARDAEADPVGDALFEHDDILFNYRRDIDAREAEAEAEAEADAEADPIGDALFEHDDILFNYKRSPTDDNLFDDIEFTDLITRSASPGPDAEGGYTSWQHSSLAQSRKDHYKSPGQLRAEVSASRGGGSGYVGDGGASDGVAGAAGGVGGLAFNEALDAGSAGATSMDAAAMDAGGLM